MSIQKILMSILVLFVIPELVGLLLVRFTKKDKNNLIYAFLIGYLTEFAIAQVLTVPMIFSEVSFSTLLKIYVMILSVLSLISFIINIFRIKDIYINSINIIKEVPKILSIVVIILICMQLYIFLAYTHIDLDDAYYVGTATTTLETDTLFKYSATTGADSGEQNLLRYRLSPFSVYFAIISALINIHPTIVAHVVIPFIFVPLVYIIYLLIANELFKNEYKSSLLFLLIINIIFLWGGYSGRTNFAFMFFRIWQGKAVLCNIIIPAIWLILMKTEKNEFKFIDLLILFILNLAGAFTTTMAIGLVPIVLMVLWFAYEISKIISKEFKFTKCFKSLIICLISCIPCLAYGVTYFMN